MITQVRGILRRVGEEELTLAIEPIELEVLIPEETRRRLQTKIDEVVVLQTLCYIESNQMAARLMPRLVGFLSPIDREFFEVFCSVDGVGARKALRAMVRPVRELAAMIQDQDVKALATLPGIGEATAERIVAKLRRKVGKFALMVPSRDAKASPEINGLADSGEPDVIRDVYAALLSVGHGESQARELIDRVLAGKKKFKTVPDMLEAIYQRSKESE